MQELSPYNPSQKGGIDMLNYSVKIESVKDLIELKNIANRYGIKGMINQNDFHGNMKSVLSNLIYLPLEDANIEIDDYKDSQVSYITKAIQKFTA